MAVTITWSVPSCAYYPEYANEADVIFVVNWQCSGTDGTNSYEIHGSCPVSYYANTPFIPYSQVTQQMMLDWIWSGGINKDANELYVIEHLGTGG